MTFNQEDKTMANDPFKALQEFKLKSGNTGKYYSLAALEKAGLGKTSRMPVSLRVVLESVLRNCDGKRVTEDAVRALAAWKPNEPRTAEVPFVLARIMLQDMAGFPALNDFAAMRAEAMRQKFDPTRIEPLVPVDLVVDHSIVVDVSNSKDALRKNMEIEFERNRERYRFLKWARRRFPAFASSPRATASATRSISNTCRAAYGKKTASYYPDTSRRHRFAYHDGQRRWACSAWGVGGIEAEAAHAGPTRIIS